MKLGKLQVRHDHRTLQFGKYVDQAKFKLPTPPSKSPLYADAVKKWGMLGNDTIGDCTIAAAMHMGMEWKANAKGSYSPTVESAIAAYSAITGFDPKTGLNDNGAVELDVLNYWRKNGIDKHKIFAYAALNLKDRGQIMDAIWLFEACYVGIALPLSAVHQSIWSKPINFPRTDSKPGSWGGHAVPIVGYDETHITCITWGATKRMTWDFFDAYCDEAYAVLSADLLDKGKCPAGFDLSALETDLKAL